MLVDDDALDPFYRPATPSRPRAGRPLPKNANEEPSANADNGGEDEPFLRARRRVPVRKGLLPKSRIGRIAAGAGAVAVLAILFVIVLAIRNFLEHDPRFRIENSAAIQILGNSEVTRPQLLSVFGSDIGESAK